MELKMCHNLSNILLFLWTTTSLTLTSTLANSPNLTDYNLMGRNGFIFKEVANATGPICSATSFSNYIIFTTCSDFLYSYLTTTGETMEVGKIRSPGITTAAQLGRKLYLGAHGGDLYEFQLTPRELKKVASGDQITYAPVALNHKIYFGYTYLFAYDPIAQTTEKVPIFVKDGIRGMAALTDSNKLYLGTVPDLIEFDTVTGQQRIISTTSSAEGYSRVRERYKKIYFGSSSKRELLQYDPETDRVASICGMLTDIQAIHSMNGKIYAGGSLKVLIEFDPSSGDCVSIPSDELGSIIASIATYDNKLYIGTSNEKLYEVYEEGAIKVTPRENSKENLIAQYSMLILSVALIYVNIFQ